VLPIDQFGSEQAELFKDQVVLDAHIPFTANMDSAISEKRNVLSTDKNSDFASAYREAAYSLLEHLNHF
jgi:cellulose biosynthesis protein BcsQ